MFQLFIQLLLIIFQVEQVQITLSGASCMDVVIITKRWPSVAPRMAAYCIPAKSPGLPSRLPDLGHFFQLFRLVLKNLPEIAVVSRFYPRSALCQATLAKSIKPNLV